MRACAYCIQTLHGTINSSTQVRSPEYILKPVSEECRGVCSTSAKVLRDLANVMKNTTNSSIQDILAHHMNSAVEALQLAYKILPSQSITQVEDQKTSTKTEEHTSSEANYESKYDDDVVPLMEIAQLSTVASLLVEIAARIEGVVKEVNQLANLAEFRDQSNMRMTKQSQSQHKEQNAQTH